MFKGVDIFSERKAVILQLDEASHVNKHTVVSAEWLLSKLPLFFHLMLRIFFLKPKKLSVKIGMIIKGNITSAINNIKYQSVFC